MKSKFLKITGLIVVVIVLVFFFFNDSEPQKEAPQAPNSEISDTKEAQKVEKVKQEEETQKEVKEENQQASQQKNGTLEALKAKIDEKPVSVAKENTSLYCTLSIECKSIYNNISDFPEEKLQLLPPDGYILTETKTEFCEGESVFDVLKRELINRGVHFEFSTAAYNSAYIEGISNIYEFDCGELSGWLYSVNGIFPQYSCSEYKLKNNDVISIIYSCALGKDVRRNIYE